MTSLREECTMKFTANTETIRNLLSIVTRALSVRPSQPVLEGVLIEVRENCLFLTASDGMFTIHASTEVNEVEPGRLLAPGRFFLETLRKLPDGEMIASQTKSGGLTLSCSGARITIGCQNGEEYPDLPEIVEPHSFSLEQKMLRDMINESSFCIADEDPRVVLTGALLEVSEGRFTMVALDGFRMAVHNRQCDTGVTEGQTAVVVPKKSLIEIARLLTEEEETVLLQIDRNYISAQLGSVRVYARLIDGEFINYQRILPTGWKTRVKVNCAQFSSCVERASLVARESKNNLMRIDVDGSRMVVTSNSDIGDSYEEIEVETDGEPMKITFNVRYLSDAFRVIKDEYVYLQMTSPISPMTIVPFGGDAFLYLILPVRAAA